ncbi:MAG: ABC transporter permease [Candidatus Zixiibacteriota bacterium]|nr:MAG: ABC transporter permease [candidate division Zixibacteria bacterium]
MFGNYLKVALRNLARHKVHTSVSVVGLVLGVSAFLLIMIWVREELSFDKFHENADRIVRVTRSLKAEDGTPGATFAKVPLPTARAIAADWPHIKTVRFFQLFGRTPLVEHKDKKFYEERFFFVDSTIFEVFSFPLAAGDPSSVLDDPFSILLTEKTAYRYFGGDNAIGKVITFENGLDYQVTGIIRDLPPTSHMHFDFLANIASLPEVFELTGLPEAWLENWYWTACHTYLLLAEGERIESFRASLPGFVAQTYPDYLKDRAVMDAQPLTDIHLHSQLEGELEDNGDIRYVRVFSVIAVLTLLTAFANYINLATARASERAKEVGVRKVCGALQGHLTIQLLAESVTISMIAALVALLTVELAIAPIGRVFGWETSFSLIGDWDLVVWMVVAVLAGGIAAGSYPAVLASKFRPSEALKGWSSGTGGGIVLRRVLIVAQFTVSIGLIIGMLSVRHQVSFMESKDLGFDRDFIVQLPLRGTGLRPQIGAFRQELLANPNISNVCLASSSPGVHHLVNPYVADDSDTRIDLPGFFVDWDFLPTLDIPLLQGRNFSPEMPTDTLAQNGGGAYILNETAVAMFGWDDPVGRPFGWWGLPNRGTVIGVVKDFHYAPMNEFIGPLVLSVALGWSDRVLVRIHPADADEALNHIVAVWDSFVPDRPCEFRFLDDELERLYRGDATAATIVGFFAGLGVLIACLGLVGLASLAVKRRTKEVGIRKVLGASIPAVTALLLREFVVLVALANIVAWPTAYYAVARWLEHFAYRVEVSWGVFILAGLATLAIAVATVTTLTFKAACANPVEVLRYE